MQPPSGDDALDFYLSPVTPAIVIRVLSRHPSGSSPNEDGITYHHLIMLLSTHHFLETLFSKLLLHIQLPPASWCQAKFLIVHKKGTTKDPSNFRPIDLTSMVAKLFHNILAMRLEEYFIQNFITDKSTEGFSEGGEWMCGKCLSSSIYYRECSVEFASFSSGFH